MVDISKGPAKVLRVPASEPPTVLSQADVPCDCTSLCVLAAVNCEFGAMRMGGVTNGLSWLIVSGAGCE